MTFVYPCHSACKKRWFCMIGLPLSLDEPAGVALLHVNLTDMLPRPMGVRAMPLAATRRKQVHTTTRLEEISGAVERSVSETLSSQLNAMLTGPGRSSARHRISAHRKSEQILADARLSKRQMQVLRLLGKGKTNKEIAGVLFRSPNTIKLHVSAILRRLKLKSRTQAALLASRLNKEESIDVEGDTRTWKKTPTPVKRRSRNVASLARRSDNLAQVKNPGCAVARRGTIGCDPPIRSSAQTLPKHAPTLSAPGASDRLARARETLSVAVLHDGWVSRVGDRRGRHSLCFACAASGS